MIAGMAAKSPVSFARMTTSSAKMHPLLSAIQFANSTAETGGATMDVHTGRNLSSGTGEHNLWSVEGARDYGSSARGRKVQPRRTAIRSEQANLPLLTVLSERERIRDVSTRNESAGRDRVHLGSYDARQSDPSRNQIDTGAANLYSDRERAGSETLKRHEDSMWGLGRGELVSRQQLLAERKRRGGVA